MAKMNPLPPLEHGLLGAMQALDNQVAREMQRSPAQVEQHGVQKWEAYAKRVENVSAFVLSSLGQQRIELDSLLILSQALIKSLRLVIDDLGEDGLGKIRTAYCTRALEDISKDAEGARQRLSRGGLI